MPVLSTARVRGWRAPAGQSAYPWHARRLLDANVGQFSAYLVERNQRLCVGCSGGSKAGTVTSVLSPAAEMDGHRYMCSQTLVSLRSCRVPSRGCIYIDIAHVAL